MTRHNLIPILKSLKYRKADRNDEHLCGAIIQDFIRVYDNSSSTVENSLLFTINIYHTSTSMNVQGQQHLLFKEKVHLMLTKLFDSCSNLVSMNEEMQQICSSLSAGKGNTVDVDMDDMTAYEISNQILVDESSNVIDAFRRTYCKKVKPDQSQSIDECHNKDEVAIYTVHHCATNNADRKRRPEPIDSNTNLCPKCGNKVTDDDTALQCDNCSSWLHCICQK